MIKQIWSPRPVLDEGFFVAACVSLVGVRFHDREQKLAGGICAAAENRG